MPRAKPHPGKRRRSSKSTAPRAQKVRTTPLAKAVALAEAAAKSGRFTQAKPIHDSYGRRPSPLTKGQDR